MNDIEELRDLAKTLDLRSKVRDSSAKECEHLGWLEDAKKHAAHAKYCRHKASVCRKIANALEGTAKSFTDGKGADLTPTTPQSKRIAALFNRRETTAWSEKEVKAYKRIGTISEDDFAALEAYYAAERAKGENGIHRRDIATFLNNFAGELDRARAAASKTPKRGQVDEDPEGYREWLKSKGLDYIEWRFQLDFLKSDFRRDTRK